MLAHRGQLARFVVVIPGRVGSTALASGLNSHPRIRAEGEELDRLKEEGAAAQLRFTRRFLRGPLVGRNRALGFRTKYWDVLDPDGFKEILADLSAAIISMTRRNRVKLAVSNFTGEKLRRETGLWNRYSDGAADPITIEPDHFDAMLNGIEDQHTAIAEFVERLGRPAMNVEYEDLLGDRDAVFAGVLEFLGLPPEQLAPQTRKNTSDDLRKAVANFDELRGRYVGTTYEAMFDEVLTP